ncbi:MAG: hypothetical protein HQK58_13380 [Deltaproteobacteria bacterium]|nr:hypothetical protein [Deltaproteobacteria bacterium]
MKINTRNIDLNATKSYLREAMPKDRRFTTKVKENRGEGKRSVKINCKNYNDFYEYN